MRSMTKIDKQRQVTPKRLNDILMVLLDASTTLSEGQWIQGKLSDFEGGHCAYGAIELGGPYRGPSAKWWAKRYLEDAIGLEYGGIAKWNDKKTRTKKQVLAAFDKAIKLVKKEMKPVRPDMGSLTAKQKRRLQ